SAQSQAWQRAAAPSRDTKANSWAVTLFSPYFWGQQEGPHQQSLLCSRQRQPGIQPTLAMPQGGRPSPGRTSATSQRQKQREQAAACTGTAASNASAIYFWCPRGTWQHSGWAEWGGPGEG
uniref:Uncharacterized protein n=1 Tax=Accipiter nisus TaxID=211598 RepID=A0A8B9M348_9AVES